MATYSAVIDMVAPSTVSIDSQSPAGWLDGVSTIGANVILDYTSLGLTSPPAYFVTGTSPNQPLYGDDSSYGGVNWSKTALRINFRNALNDSYQFATGKLCVTIETME